MSKSPALPEPAEPRDGATLPADVSAVLTAADNETLSHLLRRGIGENTLRATRSDLGYLEAWSLACDGVPLPWPPSPEIVLRFIAHHLWDPDERAVNAGHGMPADVRDALMRGGFLRAPGPHAPSTVERRIATWRGLCKWRGLDHPFSTPEVSRTLRAAKRAAARPRVRKSKRAVDMAMIERLLSHLDSEIALHEMGTADSRPIHLRALRDRALLAVMFASGGRRRSEISNLMFGQVLDLDPIEVDDPDWPDGLPSMGLRLGRTKTTDADGPGTVFLSGRAVIALDAWRTAVSRTRGPVFLRIDRWGNIHETSISPHSVNATLKRRLSEIGEDAADFSAHGVRAGYITSALKAGVPAPEIMEQTLHRSLETLMGYFKDEQQRRGRAARLL